MLTNQNQTIRCFILVKAYPQPSQQYQETVCVAAISEDGQQLLMLYTIRYRHLSHEKKFKRFDLLELKVSPAPKDKRPESFKVDEDSIKILTAGSDCTAESKASIWLNLVYPHSLTELKDEQTRTLKSLAIIKPNEGTVKFSYKKATEAPPDDLDYAKGVQAQCNLFEADNLKALEPIEYIFYMTFYSGDHEKPHHMQIHDWEVQETYRQYKKKYKDDALKKMEAFYGNDLLKLNPHFIMGNLGSRPYQFMIIGILRTHHIYLEKQPSLF